MGVGTVPILPWGQEWFLRHNRVARGGTVPPSILLLLFNLLRHMLHDILGLKRLYEFGLITIFSFAH